MHGQLLLKNYNHIFTPSLNLIYGDNGTGKTTFLRLISGEHILSDSLLTLNDRPLTQEIIKSFSFMPLNTAGLLPLLSGQELLFLFSRFRNCPLKENGVFQSALFQKCLELTSGNFSNGMRQIFRYYIHTFWDPQVLFIDEPFTFLDNTNSRIIKNDLTIRRTSTVIFLTNQAANVSDLEFDYKLEIRPHA